MKDYEITHIIIDDGLYGEEAVTTEFTHNNTTYSITFNKSDLEILNKWVLEDNTSLPANLSEELIELIRNEVKKSINK
ncbi:hypothetical protein [Metabacillus schmidteae]|uniref:hypothetical protein n=1 Tax=Metabacillus schmidteae TaxID=2730405 RepID=UPI00158A0BED|nr:hypothetical protein [Metabacillus schmidteae]